MVNSCVIVTTMDLSRCGGPTEHLAGIVDRLAKRGCQVTVLSPKPRRTIDQSFFGGVRLLHYPNVRVLGLPSAVGGLLALRSLWRLRNKNSLYVRCSPGTLPITWFGRLAKFRSVVVEHNGWIVDEVTSFGYWRGWSRLLAWSQVREAKMATVNRLVTAQLRELLAARGVERSKLVVIGNGTDTSVFRPLNREDSRRQLGIADNSKPVLAFVGNLWPGAGLEVVFKAIQLLKDRNRDVELIIAGDGIARSALEAASKRIIGADNAVRFLGCIPPAKANLVLGAADVALAPYLSERNTTVGISPLKLFAYAAAGRASVLSSLPGTEEFATQPWIFLADAGSAESFAEAIERALASNRAEICASARAYAEQNDWSVVADRISQFLFADTSTVST